MCNCLSGKIGVKKENEGRKEERKKE